LADYEDKRDMAEKKAIDNFTAGKIFVGWQNPPRFPFPRHSNGLDTYG